MRVTKALIVSAFLACAGSGMAFSLLGPFPAWQLNTYDGFNLGYDIGGDIGGPKPLSEGFRWNVPSITYAYDRTFINYFGSNGIAAVEEAIAIINDLPEATLITNDHAHLYINGERIPTDTKRKNLLAETLGLLDLKSTALAMLLEELGLAQAERYAWTLSGRNLTGPANNQSTNWTVFHLNFDPITLQPSSLVNGVLYTYEIVEIDVPFMLSEAVERPVDPLAFAFSSVAGAFNFGDFGTGIGLSAGEFFTGLTQDDVAGLRWLYNTNNLATENLLTTVQAGTPDLDDVSGSPWRPFLLITNFFLFSTNTVFATNVLTGTNATNIIVTGLRPGINKVRFERVSYDSLVGQTFVPLTNRYTDTTISNAQAVVQPVQRVIGEPDIVFTAEYLGLIQNLVPVLARRTDTASWENNDMVNGQDTDVDGGPGVILPPVRISFTDALPYFLNSTPFFLNEATASRSLIWGSFDETTNAPIVYPSYGEVDVNFIRNNLGL